MPSAPVLSPICEPGSPGTVPLAVCNTTCRDRNLFCQERDAARLAARATSGLQKEPEGVKMVCADLQDTLLKARRLKAGAEARLAVVQRTKGL